MPDLRGRKYFEITRAILDKFGYTLDCPGCDAIRRKAGQQSLSRECRERLEGDTQKYPALSHRLYARDVRHGLAPSDAGGAQPESQPVDKVEPDQPEEDQLQDDRGEEQEQETAGDVGSGYSPTSPVDSVQEGGDDHGDPGEPRGVGRNRGGEPNARSVRQVAKSPEEL